MPSISTLSLYAFVGLTSAVTLETRQSCTGQSCKVASIAGASGQTVTINDAPTGDTVSGDCCVVSYRPELAPLAIQFRPELNGTCPQYFTNIKISTAPVPRPANKGNGRRDIEASLLETRDISVADIAAIKARDEEVEARATMEHLEARAAAAVAGSDFFEEYEEVAELEKRQGCAAKILVYAKGTFEPGPLGVTLGPKLKRALGPTWDVRGVDYKPDVAGDYCLGRPGGIAASALIEQTVNQCPNSIIAVAGYSQGAMVVRNGLSYSSVASKVKGVLTFGDPFNGSPVYKYNGRIQTYCAAGDGVCGGQFQISGAHLSYGGSVAPGAEFLNSL